MRISHWKLILFVAVCCFAFVEVTAAFQVNWGVYKSESQIPAVPPIEGASGASQQSVNTVQHDGQYPVSPEDAKQSIRNATGQPGADPVLFRIDSLPIGSYYRMYVNASEYAVNQQTGAVEFVHLGENAVNSGTITITRDEAFASAQEYAKLNYPGFDGKKWKLGREGLYLHEWDGSGQYYFTWRGISKNVLTPDIVHIAVNPNNGKIIDYWGVERTISIELIPTVSLPDALERAGGFYRWFEFTGLDDEYLTVMTRTTNVQNLVYNVRMDGIFHSYKESYPVHAMAFVDAENGDPMSYWSNLVWPEDYTGF
jgi:hypothetical protein